MNKLTCTAITLATAGTVANAGGTELTNQSIAVLFEQGNYIEFSFGSVNPPVSGTQVGTIPPAITGSASGDLAEGLEYVGAALKFALTDDIDAAIIVDKPFGAEIVYPMGTGYFAGGSTATLRSTAISAIGRYKFTDNLSAYAGIRQQSLDAEAFIPFVAGWTGSTNTDQSFGYLVGAAYERPELAMRVALTYYSSISHDLETTETSPLGVGNTSIMEVNTPQAINLDFQSGVAPGTLVFGQVRWVDWSEFDISPADYGTLTGGQPLVAYEDDTITYTLGVGRQLTENWALSGFAVYEPGTGGFKSNLFPPDGRTAVGMGVTYTQDNFKLQAGLQHVWFGDGTTQLGGAPAGEFTDNTAVAFGMKAGFTF